MPETLTTNLEIISLVRGIPCNISISELREKAASCINVLLIKYSASEHPVLRRQIQDLEKACERLN